jgi:hypothetical protein
MSTPAVSASLRAPASARVLKPMMTALEACARLTSDSVIAPTAAWMMLTLTSSWTALQRLHQRFLGTLHVGLDDQRQGLDLALAHLLEHVLELGGLLAWPA